MNKIINTSARYVFSLTVMAMFATLSSCSSSPNSSNVDNQTANIPTSPIPTSPVPNSQTPAPSTSSPTPSIASLNTKPSNTLPLPEKTSTPKIAANRTVDVTLYTSDTQCQELIPQKIEVPATEPVTAAVGKILEKRDNADFNLSGYRVSIKDGIATVDLRLAPNSQRQITSLSSCEQFALFGSLRKTLTTNSQWGIKDVRFTEKGEEIVL